MNFEDDAFDSEIVQNPATLSTNQLIEQYKELSSVYLNQRDLIDRYRQKIYKLEQDLSLKDNVLEDELQSMTENHNRELEDVRRKYMVEYKDLNCRIAEQNMIIESLIQENENLRSEHERRTIEKQPSTSTQLNNCNPNEIILSKDRIEHFKKVEADHILVLDQLTELKSANLAVTSQLVKAEVSKWIIIVCKFKFEFKLNLIHTILQKKIEDLEECYECSKENFKSKVAELEDAKNIIDSMQEKLINIESELAIYKNGEIGHSMYSIIYSSHTL